MRKGLFLVFVLLGRLAPLAADEFDEIVDYLAQKELVVSLLTRIVEGGRQTVWQMNKTKLTRSGHAVTLKMSGDKLIIFAQIIPYFQSDETILLVAKGEVFVSSEDEGTNYFSTLKSLPVVLGEKVIFFPLGRAVDLEHNLYYIELEIQVLHRQEEAEKASGAILGEQNEIPGQTEPSPSGQGAKTTN